MPVQNCWITGAVDGLVVGEAAGLVVTGNENPDAGKVDTATTVPTMVATVAITPQRRFHNRVKFSTINPSPVPIPGYSSSPRSCSYSRTPR